MPLKSQFVPSKTDSTKPITETGKVAIVPAPAPPLTTAIVYALVSVRTILMMSPTTAPVVLSVTALFCDNVGWRDVTLRPTAEID